MIRVFKGLVPVFAFASMLPASAFAAWGLGIGYNNPLGSKLGANLDYIGKPFVFEIGVSAVDAQADDGTAMTGVSGDMDVKLLLTNSGDFMPYIEGGVSYSLGASAGKTGTLGFQAGQPFVGAGLWFEGSVLYAFGGADMRISTKKFFPVLGVGVKF